MGVSDKTGNYKKYISEEEEIRNGFVVTSNRKKVRNIQLGLLEEIKKICENHNLKYYANGGTMLGAIRHGGYIPWDDDLDIMMLREDYENFLEIAQKELSDNIKIGNDLGFSKCINSDTTALGDYDLWNKNFIGGIWIDIFPIDYASKFFIINKVKTLILCFFRMIYFSQNLYQSVDRRMKGGKKYLIQISKFIFNRIDNSKLLKIYNRINKKVFFRGNNVYSAGFINRYFPSSIYDTSHDVKFENTTINIPDGCDVYLKKAYGDYMKPIIYEGGHHCRYSVDKSYKDIIKMFDKSKTNEENYNNCKDLFVL